MNVQLALDYEAFQGRKVMIATGGGHHHAGFVDVAALNRALRAFWLLDRTVPQ